MGPSVKQLVNPANSVKRSSSSRKPYPPCTVPLPKINQVNPALSRLYIIPDMG